VAARTENPLEYFQVMTIHPGGRGTTIGPPKTAHREGRKECGAWRGWERERERYNSIQRGERHTEIYIYIYRYIHRERQQSLSLQILMY